MKAKLIAAAIALLPAIASAAPKAGDTMPNLTTLLPGAKLPDTKGKVVLVDFWASWCAPCEASFAALSRLHKTHSTKGLVIIGISVDEEEAKYKEFAAKQKPAFTVALDSGHKAANFFSPPGMPSSYLVDRKGKIRFIHKGFKKATEAEYTKEIETLLAE
jgi:peroxiredoxin